MKKQLIYVVLLGDHRKSELTLSSLEFDQIRRETSLYFPVTFVTPCEVLTRFFSRRLGDRCIKDGGDFKRVSLCVDYTNPAGQRNISRVRVPFFHGRFYTVLVLTSQLVPDRAPQNFRLDVSDVAVEEVLSTLGSESAFIAKYNVGAQDV